MTVQPYTNNFSSLFRDSSDPCLLNELNISNQEELTLIEARNELRDVLKKGFRSIRARNKAEGIDWEIPDPRFATQGSYAYRTQNRPAYPPIQQLDYDYGLYLPFSTLDDCRRPVETAKVYFQIVDSIIQEHIRTMRPKWTFKEKPTCARVVLNDRMHIDIPLYGVPDDEFERVKDRAAAMNESLAKSYLQFEDFVNFAVDTSVIHLAMRDGSWLCSDPLLIRRWVERQVTLLGTDVRVVARFLKSWRDQHWKDGGGPSSILLLACTFKGYSDQPRGIHARLGHVIERLPEMLNGSVEIPAPGSDGNTENLLERLKPNEITNIRLGFEALRRDYRGALLQEDTRQCNLQLQALFGNRLPWAPERIKRLNPVDHVRDIPAKIVPVVFPKSTRSG